MKAKATLLDLDGTPQSPPVSWPLLLTAAGSPFLLGMEGFQLGLGPFPPDLETLQTQQGRQGGPHGPKFVDGRALSQLRVADQGKMGGEQHQT